MSTEHTEKGSFYLFHHQRQVNEIKCAWRPKFVSADIRELVRARVEIDIGRHTCLDTGIDSVAVFVNMIAASQMAYKIRISPDIGRPGDDRSITSSIIVGFGSHFDHITVHGVLNYAVRTGQADGKTGRMGSWYAES